MSQKNSAASSRRQRLSLTCLPLLASLCLSMLLSDSCLALASDKQQPIHVRSNSAERDEGKGITVYQGSVEMVQGTLQILANQVIIHSTENKISKIIATGTPAQYQQIPAKDKKMVIARGERIEYLLADEKIKLSKNASLQQSDGTTLTGDTINYDIKASIVRAGGNTTTSERIHMIIPPKTEDIETVDTEDAENPDASDASAADTSADLQP